ncbi:MAG: hypothetical protein C0602_08470 [Denitrovibrio sp.]|nr:MAG: hypothetical protein C0602_08470 [Denitrovibrio sp.]
MILRLTVIMMLALFLTGCLTTTSRAVLKAQTVTDLKGCEKLGRIEFSGGQIFAVAMIGPMASDGAARSSCEKMGGNVILGQELCYYCSDLDTEY